MPPLPGFSDNTFRTRNDFVSAALALVTPLNAYISPENARIKIATSTGAGFSETAAQLEGFARPLWVVANFLCSHDHPSHLESWIHGFRAGTDPRSPEYWGDLAAFDQRMVEMESIAYALLSYPAAFDFRDDQTTKRNLVQWLRQINQHDMPRSNWLWFRVLVNLALVRVLGVPLGEVKCYIDESLSALDAFYISDGWSSDGLWCDGRKQADYYSGSFAIQFAQLLYVRFAPDYDEERTERYKQQAKEFAKTYWRYFGPSGAAIPFGRSLTYRFALAAFWAAAAVTGVSLPAPMHEIGSVKGLLARHLRWWAQQPDIFNTDGTPNIGYTYPNMYLAEDYNSPQSVYWCLKSFIVLGIPEDHAFWSCDELPYPKHASLKDVELIWPPRQILCNTPEHHFLLSSGQSTNKRFKAREAKYGKFAYSSAFAFSVPCGSFLEQIAPDSSIAVSFYGEEEGWKVRWDPHDVQKGHISVGGEEVPTLSSTWRPWQREELMIRTTLVPPVKKWPGWHVRVHHVRWAPKAGDVPLRVVDGGFAASAQTLHDVSIFEKPVRSMCDSADAAQGWYKDEGSALVISSSGVSGIADLTSYFVSQQRERVLSKADAKSSVIRADPNTNLISQRSLIPAVHHEILAGGHDVEFTFVTGIFAIELSAGKSTDDICSLWYVRPKGRVDGGNIHLTS